MDSDEIEEMIETLFGLVFMLPLFVLIIILVELGLMSEDYSPEIDMLYNSRSV